MITGDDEQRTKKDNKKSNIYKENIPRSETSFKEDYHK